MASPKRNKVGIREFHIDTHKYFSVNTEIEL